MDTLLLGKEAAMLQLKIDKSCLKDKQFKVHQNPNTDLDHLEMYYSLLKCEIQDCSTFGII